MDGVISALSNFVWGLPVLALRLGTGLYLSILLRGLQFRKLFYGLKQAFSKHPDDGAEGDISHFQALMTALAVIRHIIACIPPMSPGKSSSKPLAPSGIILPEGDFFDRLKCFHAIPPESFFLSCCFGLESFPTADSRESGGTTVNEKQQPAPFYGSRLLIYCGNNHT